MTMLKRFDLEDRLINFAVRILNVTKSLPNTMYGKHIKKQLLRSGTSPAPNYGEAQGAESRSDFIHKLKIALKELRETKVWLKILQKSSIIVPAERLENLINENEELISILFTSIETARKNNGKAKK